MKLDFKKIIESVLGPLIVAVILASCTFVYVNLNHVPALVSRVTATEQKQVIYDATSQELVRKIDNIHLYLRVTSRWICLQQDIVTCPEFETIGNLNDER